MCSCNMPRLTLALRVQSTYCPPCGGSNAFAEFLKNRTVHLTVQINSLVHLATTNPMVQKKGIELKNDARWGIL